MDILGLDPERRALTVSEHPFTDGYSINDVRITTHYYEDAFASNMYSVIHEGGHALFEMFQPAANHQHYLSSKTMGQHESVSRFYENIIGRSEAFVHLIYPVLRELMPDTMSDVTERELYEALNVVQPSLVRTEADEFTYTFHVIIRYEIEKEMVNGDLDLKRLPEIWNEKYREYLGVVPENDRDGVLQDMHWSSGFGYFPTYALGNMYNAMYYNRMQQDFDVMQAVSSGDMARILDWMKANVFAKADRMDPKPWIHEITGRDFTPDDFIDYLEKKYGDLYGLD
jgi:carboxypeptidase Taq